MRRSKAHSYDEYSLILASGSPRRRELMEKFGLRFRVADKFQCDESYPDSIVGSDVPVYLSALKGKAYPHPILENEILITADTVVILDGRILGKPQSRADAYDMIRSLSGRKHTVTTGVTLRSTTATVSFRSESHVHFREMSDEEIYFYIDSFRPYDKAGAYGIQEWIGHVAVTRIDGSYYNIMGLPVVKLKKELERFTAEKNHQKKHAKVCEELKK